MKMSGFLLFSKFLWALWLLCDSRQISERGEKLGGGDTGQDSSLGQPHRGLRPLHIGHPH